MIKENITEKELKEMQSVVMAEYARRGRNNLKKKLGKKGFSKYMAEIRAKGLEKKAKVDKGSKSVV